MALSPEETTRYQRHLSLPGFGAAAQESLKSASVLVVGAGGLGCPALVYLAAAGVGRIVIVDPDRVDVSNLQRQVLYDSADQGASKAEAAARRLRSLNPLIRVDPVALRLDRSNALDLVRSCDLVVDGSDNFPTRYLVNDACVIAGRPFVYGAIQGFEGQVSVFNWRGGPTYRCLFPEPPEPGTVPSCAEAGVLGAVTGIIGTVQACEAIKVLAGVGEPLSGRVLIWNTLTMASYVVGLRRDPGGRTITELPPEGYGETCEVPAAREEIGCDELRRLLGAGAPLQLLDVREHWERVQEMIDPSVHVPLMRLETSFASDIAPLDPAVPTVVYCAVGVRSLRGARILRERHGFSSAVSLRGGMKAWSSPAPLDS
jgi:molybdopterin/thiamine biosynthesis adenylyltransferase/rhodanese-related sulfurtransferase